MKKHYPELAPKFIDSEIYLKNIKVFLNDVIKKLDLKAKIEIDKIGIGCGAIVSLTGKYFVVKIYSSSFGSSDRYGSCYVMIQALCPSMGEPYNVGNPATYSLAYYANNPKYILKNIKTAIRENDVWKKIQKYRLSDSTLENSLKNFDYIESRYLKMRKFLKDLDKIPFSKASKYFSNITGIYLAAKQRLIIKKKIKCVDKGEYKHYDFLPYDSMKAFSKTHKCELLGKSRDLYFYNKKNKLLFYQETISFPVRFIEMDKKDYVKYHKKLQKFNPKIHAKLFETYKTLFLLNSRMYR